MSDAVAAALIAAGASVTGSVLAYILGIRSLRRSVSSSEGVPIGRYVESRLGSFENRLERMEHSLTELREFLAYERGRRAGVQGTSESPRPATRGA